MAEQTQRDDPEFERAREALLRQIDAEVAETGHWLGTTKLSGRVREALRKVPRHVFVTREQRAHAYENRPLPIGHGQTISQPYIVAVMSEMANPGPEDWVLEIGTGCGYQTAVLAELAGKVFTIEAVPDLCESARQRLAALDYRNVLVHCGDGSRGWPERGPFDAIVVTAAAQPGVERVLAEQLAPGGRLVIPVEHGRWRSSLGLGPGQDLQRIYKDHHGKLSAQSLLPVAFVPLTGGDE